MLRRSGLSLASFASLTTASQARSAPAGPQTLVLRPKPAPGPLDNPLKGWCPSTGRGEISQPYSLVFRYISWAELEPREGEYRFAEWEQRAWEEPGAKGKHIVLHLYADYPGKPVGTPAWLLAKGVKTTPYKDYGGGQSPDYNDPAFVEGMEQLLQAMGARYDRNPRVAFVEAGFLGSWGEGPTSPQTGMFAWPETQARILDTVHKAFPNKIIMTRYPNGAAGTQDWIGFFDDLFPEDTDGPEGWQFLPSMEHSGRGDNWKTACIGGEMAAGNAVKWLGEGYSHTLKMIEKAHVTWVGPYNPALQPHPTPEFLARSQALVRRMGYEFVLEEIHVPRQVANGKPLAITLTGRNQGVAPFYYPWQVELALLDSDHRVVIALPLEMDIRSWQPGAFHGNAAPIVRALPGQYTLALGVRDPWTNRPAIGFANALPHKEGWTLLSDLTLTRA